MNALSLYGNPRFYMGLEGLSLAMLEDPLLIEDIIEWQAHLSCEMLKKVFAAGITLDTVMIWEDMCYKTAPLASPKFVRDVMGPRYKKVVELLRANGVEFIFLDSDGNINSLLPVWLDCGINGFFPFEVASGMDAVAIRKQYGKNVVILGAVDKRALAKGKQAIDGELEKCRILLKDGGFFPSCDHHVPPDVSLENMVYFMNGLRAMSDYEETRRVIPFPPPQA
jgi:uroporphyrinogen decarboxylase